MGQVLGNGVFGPVVAAESKQFGNVAVMILARNVHNRDLPADLKTEASLLAATRHPNILSVYGIYLGDDGTAGLVIQRAGWNAAELSRRLQARHALLGERAQYAIHVGIGVARGLNHLHNSVNPSIAHSDVRPYNILLSSAAMPQSAMVADDPLRIPPPSNMDAYVMLAGFGMSRVVTALSTAGTVQAGQDAGTSEYLAPEQLLSGAHLPRDAEPARDVYALGLVLWEILSGQKPWADCRGSRKLYMSKCS